MKSESFILLLLVIGIVFASALSHKYVKEQKEANESQDRQIERVYEVLGLE